MSTSHAGFKASAQKVLEDAVGPRNRRVMKRCFMTGKQCIFPAHDRAAAPGSTHLNVPCADLSVFIVTPFRPNLETFYQ